MDTKIEAYTEYRKHTRKRNETGPIHKQKMIKRTKQSPTIYKEFHIYTGYYETPKN